MPVSMNSTLIFEHLFERFRERRWPNGPLFGVAYKTEPPTCTTPMNDEPEIRLEESAYGTGKERKTRRRH